MVNIQTVNDQSASNIAGMLINGSTMGIIDAVKKLHQYEGNVEKDIKKLMEDLREFEEKNVEELKRISVVYFRYRDLRSGERKRKG